jgi:hypothetical protein
MFLRLNLSSPIARVALAVGVLVSCGLLFLVILSQFIIGTLADDRLAVSPQMLQVPLGYFPNSSRLNARLAAAELTETERDLNSARNHAQHAINLSPYDYRIRITEASVEEADGDRAAAEATLEAARSLAPNYWTVNYRLGNLLIRQGKLQQSLDPFRVAVAGNSTLLPGTLDLLWRTSRNDVKVLETVTGSSPRARLTLAQFLVKASRPAEAAGIFGSIDVATVRASPDSATFLNSLIANEQFGVARDFWTKLAGAGDSSALLWNGSFETDLLKNYPQFDWTFTRTEYARFSVDNSVAHSGSRSLKIEFAGRDTTKLDNEIRQLVLVQPGKHYQLECYVKTNGLESPEGPRVVVTRYGTSDSVASSDPVAQGSNDWQRLTVDFVAPTANGDKTALVVSIKRKPKFSYDEPTRGTVWFDDFALNEQ